MKTLDEQVAERKAWRPQQEAQRHEEDEPEELGPARVQRPPKSKPTKAEAFHEAQRLYRMVLDELHLSPRCAVVIGMETEYQVLRMEAVDSWLADPTRFHRFLFMADRKTTLGDVEWLLSR